jgi:prolipoprotein diacylglyceryltransferase
MLLDPGSGFSILFVPLGLLLTTPWRAPAAERVRHLAAAFGALPLGFAVARSGCLFAGCCHGIETDLPWAILSPGGRTTVHPTPLYEILGWLALDQIVRHVSAIHVAPLVLGGFGLLRIALEPWRAAPPLGLPSISITALAWLWVASALVLHRWLAAEKTQPRFARATVGVLPVAGVSARSRAKSV